MEFVDYKCLESLIIEGEDLIATEGFFGTIWKGIKSIAGMFGKAILFVIETLNMIRKFIWGIIKKGYHKITGGKKNKNGKMKEPSSNESNPTASGNQGLTTDFKNAVEKNDLLTVRIMIKDQLCYDNYSDNPIADEEVKYAQSKMKLFVPHDGTKLETDQNKWTINYMNLTLVEFVNNFSKERYEHLKKVIPVAFANRDSKDKNDTNDTSSKPANDSSESSENNKKILDLFNKMEDFLTDAGAIDLLMFKVIADFEQFPSDSVNRVSDSRAKLSDTLEQLKSEVNTLDYSGINQVDLKSLMSRLDSMIKNANKIKDNNEKMQRYIDNPSLIKDPKENLPSNSAAYKFINDRDKDENSKRVFTEVQKNVTFLAKTMTTFGQLLNKIKSELSKRMNG